MKILAYSGRSMHNNCEYDVVPLLVLLLNGTCRFFFRNLKSGNHLFIHLMKCMMQMNEGII